MEQTHHTALKSEVLDSYHMYAHTPPDDNAGIGIRQAFRELCDLHPAKAQGVLASTSVFAYSFNCFFCGTIFAITVPVPLAGAPLRCLEENHARTHTDVITAGAR